jgi:hypothetical protein
MDTKGEIEFDKLIKPLKADLTDKQVDILIALSDNKGYEESELEEMIGSWNTYANKLLGELSSYKFGDATDSLSIQPYHLKDPISLAHKIQDQRDAPSKYIFKNMSNLLKQKINGPDLNTITLSLALGLEELLFDVNFYSRDRFRGVKLSKSATKLIDSKENLKGGRIRILNRTLLEEAYPEEICESRFPLIHKSSRRDSEGRKNLYFINLDLRTFNFVAKYLGYKIKLDRNEIELLRTRFENQTRILGNTRNLLRNPT